MAIGRISGSVLKSNLTRNGVDLAFETNLLYLDVTNSRVGIGTSEPSTALQVAGTVTATAFAGDGSNLTGINVDTNIQLVGDDSTGATLGTGETFKIAGGTNITTAVSGDTLTVTGPDLSSYITATSTDTLQNKTLRAPVFESGSNSPQFIEQRFVNANQLNFVQAYSGAASGSYFTQGEYQKIATIIPDSDSQNYTCKVTMTATSASNFHIVTFYAALRSNTLPDLDWTVTYEEQHNGTRFIEPMLWTKETTTAGFILAFEYIHGSNLYGNVNCDVEIIPRSAAQRDNVTINTTANSEQTSIDAGYTERNPTLIQSNVSGTPVFNQTISFEGATDDGNETSITVTDPTADRTITIPDATGTIVLQDSTDTLTNKTINSASNTITITESNISDLGSYITASSTDTLTNKTFDANGTGNSLSNIEVSDFASGEVLDEDNMASDSATKLATQQSIKAYVDSQVTAQDLDFQADSGGALSIDLDSETMTFTGGTGIDTSGSGNAVTFAIDSTVATLTGSQTLTNKTLTTPVISSISNTGTITLPTSTDTLVGRATTDTLTNKTLTSPTINGFSGTGNGTITGTLSIDNTTTGDTLLLTTTEASSTAAPVLTFKRNSDSPADADYLGQLKFKGENDADQEVVYAKITGKISDASDTTEDGLIEFALRKAGSNNIGARLTSTELKLINGTGLEVAGLTYPTSDGSAGQVLKTDGSGNLSFTTISTNSVSQGNSNVTVTDSGTGTIGITTDGTNIVNFSTALAIDASNSNTALRLPVGTSGQRPAGAVGMIRYNSSTDKIEGYTTAEGWAEFGAGASSGSDESGDSVIGIGPNPKNITTFTTGTYDSAFFYAILRDESNDEVSTARYSLVHNDTGAFVATSHVNESDTANDYMTVDADITDGVVRLRGTGVSNINSVSYYEIPLGDNTEVGTTGNVTKFINTDVDSASEVIDSFALSSIRGAKYFISTKDDASGEVSNTEAIVVHDGSTAYITQYGSVNATDNNRDLLTLTVEVDSTVVLVKASSSIANVRVTGYRIALGDSESADTGDNVNVVAATTVNSGATALDTFASDVYTGAFYVVVGYNSTEGAASISEVSVVTNGGVSYVSTGPVLSTKETDQLSFTTGVSGTTVTLNAASTSGSSTTVNAYRVHMLRGIGGAVADTVTVSDDETISGIKTFTAPLTLTVGSDPSTVANNAHIYAKDESSSAEVFVRDEAGNVTKISPHNEQGEWEYYSRNTKTGKTVRVNMEEMIRDIEKLTGKSYIKND